MEITIRILEQWIEAVPQLFLNPIYYLSVIMVVLFTYRQILLERKLFHSKLHRIGAVVLRAVLWGWVAGVAGTLMMAVIGSSLTFNGILLLWVITGVLMLFRIRFLCMAYSAGIIGVLQALVPLVSVQDGERLIDRLSHVLNDIHVPSLLLLVAVLHFVEGLLVRRQGGRMATPLFLESNRGKIIGGYYMQGFWPVPLFLMVPMTNGIELTWSPWFTSAQTGDGWGFLAFPAMIGFTQLTTSFLPNRKAKQLSGALFSYAILLSAAAWLAQVWHLFVLPAAVLSIALHEVIIQYNQRIERRSQPLFIHSDQGLKIMAVIPDSPAGALGLQAGEIIDRVNGMKVATKEQLHKGLRLNSAFCRLEILDQDGEKRFLSRALYEGEHHQLGVILCPDNNADVYVKESSFELFAFFSRERRKSRQYANISKELEG